MSKEPLRLMAVHAHPDDESSKGAASMAKYVNEGVEVLVVTCTGGERGDVLNPAMKDDRDVKVDMASVRRREMAEAAEILGVQQVWLGYADSGLPEGDPEPPLPADCFAALPLEYPTAALVRLIREFRPHVMTTYDENGGYPHPDHIRCHEVSVAAFAAAADQLQFPEHGEAWQISKLYYNHGFNRLRLRAVHDALLEEYGESPFDDWFSDREEFSREITTKVECAEYFDVRDRALRAHATQVDPEGFFFSVSRELEVRIWPWDCYELVTSRVPTSVPEDDLFAGLR